MVARNLTVILIIFQPEFQHVTSISLDNLRTSEFDSRDTGADLKDVALRILNVQENAF